MAKKIGLIGIGLVGTAIAERLLNSKFDIVGFDIDSTKRRRLEQLGGKAVNNPAEVAARQAHRIILSLPDTDVVLKVIEGPGGILEAKTLPQYIIDTTTGDPEKTQELAHRLAKKEIYLLDSTIPGSSQQVR